MYGVSSRVGLYFVMVTNMKIFEPFIHRCHHAHVFKKADTFQILSLFVWKDLKAEKKYFISYISA